MLSLTEQNSIRIHGPHRFPTLFPAIQILAVEQRLPSEVRRQFDLTSGGPFHSAREKGLKVQVFQVWARLVLPGVAKHGRIHTPATVQADPVHGLALSRHL